MGVIKTPQVYLSKEDIPHLIVTIKKGSTDIDYKLQIKQASTNPTKLRFTNNSTLKLPKQTGIAVILQLQLH